VYAALEARFAVESEAIRRSMERRGGHGPEKLP
jgi:hypothetical protein